MFNQPHGRRSSAATAMSMIATAFLLLVLAGCGDGSVGDGAAGDDAGSLDGSWVLATGEGPDGAVEPPASHPVTLDIEGTDWRGTAACNSYSASVEVDGEQLSSDGLAATEMACEEDGVMEAEAAYIAAFAEVDTWALEGDTLVLTGTGTELRFDRD